MTDTNLARSIRAIGILQYFISGVFALMGLLSAAVFLFAAESTSRLRTVEVLPTVSFHALVWAFFFFLARSLRRFRPWARWVTIGICCIGVLGFPLGTLVNGAFLYVLFKGKHLFHAQPPVITSPDGVAQVASPTPPPVPENRSPSPA